MASLHRSLCTSRGSLSEHQRDSAGCPDQGIGRFIWRLSQPHVVATKPLLPINKSQMCRKFALARKHTCVHRVEHLSLQCFIRCKRRSSGYASELMGYITAPKVSRYWLWKPPMCLAESLRPLTCHFPWAC